MPRIRTIKPEQPKDEELAALSIHARYLFAFLPCIADRKGRLEDRPRVIKLEILPWDDVDCDKLLAELSPRFVIRYENGGRRYLQIRTFEKHQRPHPKEAESEIPAPLRDGPGREKVVAGREKDMISKVDSGKESLTMDNGKEILDKMPSPPSPAQTKKKSQYQELVEFFAANRKMQISNPAIARKFFAAHGEAAKEILEMSGGSLTLAQQGITEISSYLDKCVNEKKIDEWRNLKAVSKNFPEWWREYSEDQARKI